VSATRVREGNDDADPGCRGGRGSRVLELVEQVAVCLQERDMSMLIK